jgi:hypothetical protein
VKTNSRLALFLLWLAGILLPMAWFGRFSSSYRQAFNLIFSPQWMHIVMHAFLYAGLVVLFSPVFRLFGYLVYSEGGEAYNGTRAWQADGI